MLDYFVGASAVSVIGVVDVDFLFLIPAPIPKTIRPGKKKKLGEEMKKITLSILCVRLMNLAGCAKVGVTRMNPSMAKAKNCPLQIFSDEFAIKRKFTTACLIDSRTGTTLFHDRSVAAAVENAKSEACQCGADVLIIKGARTEGMSYASWGMGAAIMRAIKFVDADQSQVEEK